MFSFHQLANTRINIFGNRTLQIRDILLPKSIFDCQLKFQEMLVSSPLLPHQRGFYTKSSVCCRKPKYYSCRQTRRHVELFQKFLWIRRSRFLRIYRAFQGNGVVLRWANVPQYVLKTLRRLIIKKSHRKCHYVLMLHVFSKFRHQRSTPDQ